MNEDGALFDARFDDGEPFRDTPEAGGISLESALRDFGPAALDDLIPRVRALARQLDLAHTAGAVHGALHPSNVIVYDEATSLINGTTSTSPYIAPEVAEGDAPDAASDLYSLAAITYEWLFGRPIDGPAHRPVDVKAMPGVDRVALSRAFTRALSPQPGDRFASCADFCDALAATTTPELPLLAFDDGDDDDDRDPVGPFIPEPAIANVDDLKIVAEETNLTAAQPDLDAIDQAVPFDSERESPFLAQGKPVEAAPVSAWNPAAPAASGSDSARFSGVALIIAAIVGALFGFAGGYMARPRALQSGPAETFATTPGTESAVAPAAKSEAPPISADVPAANASKELAKVAEVPKAATKAGRLLVRSSPSGATVTVDGAEKGVTPLALRDLDFGAHNVVIARRGSNSESRRVVITAGRPSRSIDVKLSASTQPKPVSPKRSEGGPKPSTPATLRQAQGRPEQGRGTTIGKPAASTGGLNVDSRPSGASVTINGKASGKTPLTINDLRPGDYRILMTLPGYLNYTTTVRVVAGERVRAAASLTAQEKE